MNTPLIPHIGKISFSNAADRLTASLRRLGISSVLTGTSGGADSMLTLHLLAAAARRIEGFRLGICHVNFRLRGEESMRDQRLVELTARHYVKAIPGTAFHLHPFDTERYASDAGISIEMAARELRHNLWDDLMREYSYERIATGHNADDNEETLLLNLLRGSSPHGLRGMAPAGERIIRPLLYFSHKEIVRILREVETPDEIKGLFPEGYVVDSTNLSSEYRRNFLRNEIIPMLENRWEGVHSALQTTLRLQSESADIIDHAVATALSAESDPEILHWSTITAFPSPVTLIFHWLKPHGISSDIACEAAGHAPSCGEKISPTPGRIWILPDGAELITTPTALKIRIAEKGDSSESGEWRNPEPMEWEKIALTPEIFEKVKRASNNEIYIPCDPASLEWRIPRKGERMKLFGEGKRENNASRGSKLISDILKEGGIPLSSRNSIMLLADKETGESIWIPGIRRAGIHLITPPGKKPESGATVTDCSPAVYIYHFKIRIS